MAGFLNLDGDDTIHADSVNVTILTAEHGSSVYAYGSNNTIDAGAGNDSIWNYGSYASIDGGAGNDYIQNWRPYASIDAGSDNDFILSSDDSVTINAGDGNDSIENLFGYYASIDAGAGNDSIYNSDSDSVTIDAGAGNDEINNRGNFVSINAGVGNDSIYNRSDSVTIDAGDGNDSITNYGESLAIDAGSGNDDIESHGDSVTIDAGAGNDEIWSSGDHVTIDAGDGNDTIMSYWADCVSIYGGTGNDLISLSDLGSSYDKQVTIGYTNGDGNDTIYNFNGDDVLNINGSWSSVESGNNTIVQIGNGQIYLMDYVPAQDVTVSGSNSTVTTGAGHDSIYNSYGSVTINAGAGNDEIWSGGDHVTIDAGSGNDTLNIYSGKNVSISMGAGADLIIYEIPYEESSAIVYDFTEGDRISIESLTIENSIQSGSDVIITFENSDSYASVITLQGVQLESLAVYDSVITYKMEALNLDGNDTIYANDTKVTIYPTDHEVLIYAHGSSYIIDAGSGDDYIYNYGSYASIDAGDGDDSIRNYGESLAIDAGSGNDDIESHGDSVTIDAGAGNDEIWSGGDHVTIDAGDGNDYIVNQGGYTSIDAGDGNDSIYNNYSDSVTIYAGLGDDLINLSAIGSYVIGYSSGFYYRQQITIEYTNGDGNDTIYNFNDNDVLNINGSWSSVESGNNTIVQIGSGQIYLMDYVSSGPGQGLAVSVSNSTVTTGAGNDRIYNPYDSVTIDAGSGNDTIWNYQSSNTSINAGDGNDGIESWGSFVSINAGDGNDEIWSGGDHVTIDAGAGNDTIWNYYYVSDVSINAGDGDDSIYNEGDSVTIDAGTGNDSIENLFGYYTSINAGDGNDSIYNSNSDSVTIDAGAGNDTIWVHEPRSISISMGAGSDLFIFEKTDWEFATIMGGYESSAIVYDFTSEDQISIGSMTIEESIQSGSDVVITFDRLDSYSHVVTLQGVQLESLSVHDSLISYGIEVESEAGSGSDFGSGSTSIGNSLVGTESIGSAVEATASVSGIDAGSASISGEIVTDAVNYVTIDNSGNIMISSVSNDDSNASISVDSETHAATINSSSDSNADYNLKFAGGTQIAKWTAVLAGGNDKLTISNVTGGTFTAGEGQDMFEISSQLNGNITLSGGGDGNLFHAGTATISSASAQKKISVTDVNFDNTDALLVDAGIENLTKKFFGDGKFFNYANAAQASTSGVYAKNVFDASDLVSKLNMKFSMVKMANASVSVNSDNSIDESNIVNVVWTNSNATTVDFSNQDDDVLIFADTNKNGDLIILGEDYNDTIHVGTNDTVNPGAGDDIIYGWSSNNVLVLDEVPETVSMSGSDLILESDSSNVTIAGVNSKVKAVVDGDYYLIGNSSNNILTAESTSTTLWGNGGNDKLIGGNGADVFRFTASDDRVTIQNGDSNDTVEIDFDFSDVSNYEFTSAGVVLSIGDSSLNVIGSDLTTFNFSNGTHIADFSNKTL